MAAGLYFVLSSFLIFYSILGVILAQRSHLINYEVLIIEDVYGFAKDGQCLDSCNSILQICLSDRQVKRISKCKSSLLIPKSMKHSVVSLAFPTKFAVMDVTMYMAISFNLGFDLPSSCKHMKSDKANDILCSMCLTDNNYNNKIKYSCDHLLLSQEPASPNLLSLTNLKHCGVTTGLAVRYNGIQARFYKISLAVRSGVFLSVMCVDIIQRYARSSIADVRVDIMLIHLPLFIVYWRETLFLSLTLGPRMWYLRMPI